MSRKGQQFRLQVGRNEPHRLARSGLNGDGDRASSHGAEALAGVVDLHGPEVWWKLKDVLRVCNRAPSEPRNTNGMGLLVRVLRDASMPGAAQSVNEVDESGGYAESLGCQSFQD